MKAEIFTQTRTSIDKRCSNRWVSIYKTHNAGQNFYPLSHPKLESVQSKPSQNRDVSLGTCDVIGHGLRAIHDSSSEVN